MKKTLLTATLALLLAASCQESQQASPTGKCHISGTISQKYNDKRIFLVPLYGPKTAEYVDSVEIKDGRFEFTKDSLMMAKILVDYHYRMGLQPLLVVVEPGEVSVTIDSISHATGTPQNDSLDKWKAITERHNNELLAYRQAGRKAEVDSMIQQHKLLTRRLAANMESGLLHDFLEELYPLTYKKQLPDGRIVTMDADTHEQIDD